MKFSRTCFAAALLILLAIPAFAQMQACPPPKPPSVVVAGSGEARGKPDTAYISAGVVSEGLTAGEALKKNSDLMVRLIASMKKRGIEERDIQTSQFNVSPRYHYDKSQQESPRITGYQVTNEVRVRVRQIASLGAILDETVASGANQVRGIRFDVAEPGILLDQARKKAVEDARHRASVYAEAAGVKIGKPVLIEEQQRATPYPAPRMDMMAASAAVPIESGEQAFTVQVTVSFPILE